MRALGIRRDPAIIEASKGRIQVAIAYVQLAAGDSDLHDRLHVDCGAGQVHAAREQVPIVVLVQVSCLLTGLLRDQLEAIEAHTLRAIRSGQRPR